MRQREGRLHGGGLPRSRRVVIERMRRGARLIASSPGERRRQCDAPQCGSVQMVGQGHHHDRHRPDGSSLVCKPERRPPLCTACCLTSNSRKAPPRPQREDASVHRAPCTDEASELLAAASQSSSSGTMQARHSTPKHNLCAFMNSAAGAARDPRPQESGPAAAKGLGPPWPLRPDEPARSREFRAKF